MVASITINGVDWTSKIGELSLNAKESKKTEINVKGDGLTIPNRSGSSGKSVKAKFFYLSRADYLSLLTLYNAGAPVAVGFTGLDLTSGNYIIVEFVQQLLKSLTDYVYNVELTFQQDVPPTLPVPTTPTKPLAQAGVPNKLGW
jgi:hypothetical protein